MKLRIEVYLLYLGGTMSDEKWSFKKAWDDGWLGHALRWRLKETGAGDVQYFYSLEEAKGARGHRRRTIQELVNDKWIDVE